MANQLSTPQARSPAASGLLRPAFGSPVSICQLSKKYGEMLAVDDVSIDVSAGEFVSLLGPSGSGKTTILMMLAGFEVPSSGIIEIGGLDVTAVPPFKRDIGMVFQSYALFPHMTVFDNIAYPLKLRKLDKAEISERVRSAMDMVRLPAAQYAGRYPQQLSGGQRQRIALVRALVYEPRVLLMDEPMGALDKNLREELKLELIALKDRLGLTIIYVTHDQGEALMLSDRVVVMRDGRIEQIDHPKRLYKRPATEFVARFLGEANLLALSRRGDGRYQLTESITLESSSIAADRIGRAFMLRPEDIQLVDAAHARLIGRVEKIIFLGSSTRAEIDTDVGKIAVIASSIQAETLRVGASVGLWFDTNEPVILTRDSV